LGVLYSDPAESQVSPENFDVVRSKLLRVVRLVYYLSHADHHPLVVADWHSQDGVGILAGLQVHVAAEARVLQQTATLHRKRPQLHLGKRRKISPPFHYRTLCHIPDSA
jgi:hypothetical protein